MNGLDLTRLIDSRMSSSRLLNTSADQVGRIPVSASMSAMSASSVKVIIPQSV